MAEIAIDRVEKGEGLKAGGIVQVRYHAQGWLGSGTPPPYDSGHSPTPKQDDSVRAYLVNHGYNGEGYTTDDQYDVFYKNGFEILHYEMLTSSCSNSSIGLTPKQIGGRERAL